MNDNAKPVQVLKSEREKALAMERRKILSMSPEKALDAIAEHPYPVTLVQSMAEEELYFLVHHVGPEDALPILGLASNSQWEYLIDLEGWSRDRMASHSMTQWLQRLLQADNDRFTHWITKEKVEDFVFYLHHNVELHIREYDQDPGEIDEGFSSEDQTYYVRLRPYPEAQKPFQEERDLFLKDLLRRVSVFDYTLYRDLLLEASAIIPAEAEEQLYRLRNARLAEKGILPLEEAVGVYQPLQAGDLTGRPKPPTFGGRNVDTYPLPIQSGPSGEPAGHFGRALAQIHDEATLQRLQAEFAALCNQIISADQLKVRDRETLARVVQKAGDYISLGLEKIQSESGPERPYAGPGLLQTQFLADLFRVGYGCALALKWRANKWRHTAWFAAQGLPLGFWGEQWLGLLGGLLLKKPLCYNHERTGPHYREFASLADITRTQAELDAIIAFDDLLGLMALETAPIQSGGFLTYQSLILTLWADHELGISGEAGPTPVPLSLEQFQRFFDTLWRTEHRPRRIGDAMRERFLNWLAQRSGLATYEIAERMAPALQQLFSTVEQELGEVDASALDPRYIQLFLLRS
jgi:hypothetical protein